MKSLDIVVYTLTYDKDGGSEQEWEIRACAHSGTGVEVELLSAVRDGLAMPFDELCETFGIKQAQIDDIEQQVHDAACDRWAGIRDARGDYERERRMERDA